MPSKGTTIRSVRVSDDLWQAARDKAEAEKTSVSEVLVAALVRYVKS